jgi:hypothetical protein
MSRVWRKRQLEKGTPKFLRMPKRRKRRVKPPPNPIREFLEKLG